MAHVPLELRLSLREGSVYYFRERKLTSAKPHYYIAVNDPLSQQVLLLTVVTSKIAKVRHRRRDCLNTLVELGPAELPGVLTLPSIIDCNTIIRIGIDEFSARWARKEISCFGRDLPAPIRQALRKAIHASSILPNEIKALVAKAD